MVFVMSITDYILCLKAYSLNLINENSFDIHNCIISKKNVGIMHKFNLELIYLGKTKFNIFNNLFLYDFNFNLT